MGLPGCQGLARDPCHRIGRKAGGRHGAARQLSDRPSNLIHGCRACHSRTHALPALAREWGLMLAEGEDPLRAPARLPLHGAGRVWLTDDGRVLETPE